MIERWATPGSTPEPGWPPRYRPNWPAVVALSCITVGVLMNVVGLVLIATGH